MSALVSTAPAPAPTDVIKFYSDTAISVVLGDPKILGRIMDIYDNIPEFIKTAILCLMQTYKLELKDNSITIGELLRETEEKLNPSQGEILKPPPQPIEFINGGKINKNKKKRDSNSGRTIKPRRNKKRRTLRTLGGHGPFSGALFGKQPGEREEPKWEVLIMCFMVYLVIGSAVTAFRAI